MTRQVWNNANIHWHNERHSNTRMLSGIRKCNAARAATDDRKHSETSAPQGVHERITARAERGASLPLALFLFMICALVASIVISASTAVAGRHVQLTHADQRYYSITSAAQLMKEEFESQRTAIVLEEKKTVTTTTTYNSGGGATTSKPEESGRTVTMRIKRGVSADADDGFATSIDIDTNTSIRDSLTLPELTAVYMMLPDDPTAEYVDPEEAWDAKGFDLSRKCILGSFEMEHSGITTSSRIDVSEIEDALKVTGVEDILEGGEVRFRFISAPSNDDARDSYRLTLTCVASIDEEEQVEEGVPTVVVNDMQRTESREVTTTRTATVSWEGSVITKTGEGA